MFCRTKTTRHWSDWRVYFDIWMQNCDCWLCTYDFVPPEWFLVLTRFSSVRIVLVAVYSIHVDPSTLLSLLDNHNRISDSMFLASRLNTSREISVSFLLHLLSICRLFKFSFLLSSSFFLNIQFSSTSPFSFYIQSYSIASLHHITTIM